MTTTEPIESHAIHSRRMLEHAAEMIEQGDRLQASEKLWGAAAHRLKEIAEERGWPNSSHADGFAIAGYLADQARTPLIASLFATASDTHQNFYEDRLDVDDLERRLRDIRALLALLDEAHAALPPDLPMPTARRYRERHT